MSGKFYYSWDGLVALGPLFPFSPGYVYPRQPEPQVEPVKAPVKCDCGSEAAGLGDVHSDWCAKGRGP